MKISEKQMSIFEHAISDCLSDRHQFVFFDLMVRAFGVKPSRSFLKLMHTKIKEGKTEKVTHFVLCDYETPERTSPLKLNKVQYRLLKHIVHTFRRLQKDENKIDSFLTTRADSYTYAMIGFPAPGAGDTDTLIRMLKDGSTDEEIIKWYIGDFTIAVRKVKLNKDDYRKMKYALETKDISVLKDLNLGPGIIEESLINALEANAYAGKTLEETFGPFELTDGPTEFITQEDIDRLLNS